MKLKVSVPIVKESSSSWEKYKTDGTLEIEFEGSEFEEKVNTLLKRVDAQFLLIKDSQKLGDQIEESKNKLAGIQGDLKVARAQLDRVSQFLKGLGINPRDYLLRVDENFKLRSAEIESSNDCEDENEDENEEDEDD